MTTTGTLKAIRVTHNYVGVFLAPTILFFAITGALQMFGLHETARGSSYQPPSWLVHLSQLHKKGTLYLAPKKAGPAATVGPAGVAGAKVEVPKPEVAKTEKAAPAAPAGRAGPPHNPWPIKIFFVLTAWGLVTSTLTGLVMAWKYARRKGVVAGTLVAGIVVPLALLLV